MFKIFSTVRTLTVQQHSELGLWEELDPNSSMGVEERLY